MCRVNIRPDIAFYSAMEGTTGQVLKEENDPGLGRRLLYNRKLTVYYSLQYYLERNDLRWFFPLAMKVTV